MKFKVDDKPSKTRITSANQMDQGDIAVIIGGPRYVGYHLMCIYAGSPGSENKAWTTIEDPHLKWDNYIPETILVRLLEVGDSFTITRTE